MYRVVCRTGSTEDLHGWSSPHPLLSVEQSFSNFTVLGSQPGSCQNAGSDSMGLRRARESTFFFDRLQVDAALI